jgi:2-desacetyl-2-hydroxyethyl bacteriochlorophyllide A dehydrogenase
MLAVVFPHPNAYELAQVPIPQVATSQVLVKVKSTTICATDTKIFHGLYPGVSYPHIPGHEWGGEIVEIGQGINGLEPNDKVGVEVHVGCGSCPPCQAGLYNLCENYGRPETGHAHIGFTVPGGLAEFCAVPAKAVHVLPDGLEFDHGAFTDSVGIALWAFERAGGVRPGEVAAIVGPGAFGLLSVQIARNSGARQVIAIGTIDDAERLALASELGADHTLAIDEGDDPAALVKELTYGRGADLVVEFAGTARAARHAIEMARRGGRVVLCGATSPGRRLEVDLSTIVRGHLDIFGSMANPRGISRRANELMASGMVDIQPLISHHMPLSDFPRAWDLFQNRKEDSIRIMLHP